MSFTKLIYHIVFSTANRAKTIPADAERELYAILFHVASREGAHVYRIGGMSDHLHAVFSLPPSIPLSKIAQAMKRESSLLLKSNPRFPDWNGWEDGYGAFTVGYRDVSAVVEYVKSQKEHHRVKPFIDEYREWLLENGISEDAPFFPKKSILAD